MKLEYRHRIIATLMAAIATVAAAAVLSVLSGIRWQLVAASGYPGVVYLGLFALAFGWPTYILIRAILAKKAGVPYSIRRNK